MFSYKHTGLLSLVVLGAVASWCGANYWSPSLPRPQQQPTATTQTVPEPVVKIPGPPLRLGTGSALVSSSEPNRLEFLSAGAMDKVGLQVVPAVERDLTRSVAAPGLVEYDPTRYARLTPRASGNVWRLYKDIGDTIHKGEVLGLIEAADAGKAKADFILSFVEFELHDGTAKRLEAAAASLPGQTVRAAEAAQLEARIRLFNNRQALLNLGYSIQIEDIADLSVTNRFRHLRLLGLPDALRQEEGAESLTANLLPLTAPFDGQVVQRNAATGELVQTNQPQALFVVADVRQVRLDLDVNPAKMAEVHVGQRVTFTQNDVGAEASGVITHISPEVDAKTQHVHVHAEVSNADGRLRPNAAGTARIVGGEQRRAVVVPSAAVQVDGGISLVFVRVSETVFEVRPVQPGLRQADIVEVSGVRPGEEVVTEGSVVLCSEWQKERTAGRAK